MGKYTCQHPDRKCRSTWTYTNGKVKWASGYCCEVCGETFVWNGTKLVPGRVKKKVVFK